MTSWRPGRTRPRLGIGRTRLGIVAAVGVLALVAAASALGGQPLIDTPASSGRPGAPTVGGAALGAVDGGSTKSTAPQSGGSPTPAGVSTATPFPPATTPVPTPTAAVLATPTRVATATPVPSRTVTITPSPPAPTQTVGVTPTPTPTAAPTPTTAPTPTATPAPTPPPVPDPVLMGAGDICITASIANAYATANLILAVPEAHVFTAGDNSNESGTAAQYVDCVAKAWGQFESRTRPVPGNHDYLTTGAQPYYDFYGSLAGNAGQGWYSYDLPNDWHVVGLNALCSNVGGCGSGSPQEVWLRQDLAANAGKHIIAVWHIPEFTSGQHGNTAAYSAWWQDLYAAHAEIVLNGHDHDYERFARQTPAGLADSSGIREFVVGTGGAGQRTFATVAANSEVRNSGTFGVLKLTLHAHSYEWEFVPAAGGTFRDSGTTATHS